MVININKLYDFVRAAARFAAILKILQSEFLILCGLPLLTMWSQMSQIPGHDIIKITRDRKRQKIYKILLDDCCSFSALLGNNTQME